MQYRELEEPAALENAVDLPDPCVVAGHVHEAHEGDGEVEPLVGEGQRAPAGAEIGYAKRFFVLPFLRMADELRRNVQSHHVCAALCDQPRVVPLPAPDIEAAQPLDLRQHAQKGGRVDIVAADIAAHPRQQRPRVSVPIPQPPDLVIVHAVLPIARYCSRGRDTFRRPGTRPPPDS